MTLFVSMMIRQAGSGWRRFVAASVRRWLLRARWVYAGNVDGVVVRMIDEPAVAARRRRSLGLHERLRKSSAWLFRRSR